MDIKAIIITGPIGSGKSTALSIIKKLGYNTIDLDEVSGRILTSNDSIKFLSENFPTTIVDNEVSRKKIADIVFSGEKKCWPDNSMENIFKDNGLYKYINSGGFIGKVEEIYKLIEEDLLDTNDDQYFIHSRYEKF